MDSVIGPASLPIGVTSRALSLPATLDCSSFSPRWPRRREGGSGVRPSVVCPAEASAHNSRDLINLRDFKMPECGTCHLLGNLTSFTHTLAPNLVQDEGPMVALDTHEAPHSRLM